MYLILILLFIEFGVVWLWLVGVVVCLLLGLGGLFFSCFGLFVIGYLLSVYVVFIAITSCLASLVVDYIVWVGGFVWVVCWLL